MDCQRSGRSSAWSDALVRPKMHEVARCLATVSTSAELIWAVGARSACPTAPTLSVSRRQAVLATMMCGCWRGRAVAVCKDVPAGMHRLVVDSERWDCDGWRGRDLRRSTHPAHRNYAYFELASIGFCLWSLKDRNRCNPARTGHSLTKPSLPLSPKPRLYALTNQFPRTTHGLGRVAALGRAPSAFQQATAMSDDEMNIDDGPSFIV